MVIVASGIFSLTPLLLSFALLLVGAAAALASANAAKRVIGLTIAMIGAVAAGAALHAPAILLVAGVAVALAQCLLGLALIVRLQESYGGAETLEIEDEDRRADAAERAA